MQTKQAKGRYQQGFSLPEVLIAALLFAVSLLGLLHYHQVLMQSFQRQWQYRQAWSLAQQHLDIYSVSSDPPNSILSLPPHWHSTVETDGVQAPCLRRTIKIQTSLQLQVELSRWYCHQ